MKPLNPSVIIGGKIKENMRPLETQVLAAPISNRGQQPAGNALDQRPILHLDRGLSNPLVDQSWVQVGMTRPEGWLSCYKVALQQTDSITGLDTFTID